jgi:hypothetical protein
MAPKYGTTVSTGYHESVDNQIAVGLGNLAWPWGNPPPPYPDVSHLSYTFTSFFHPLVEKLLEQLNRTSLDRTLDPGFLLGLSKPFDQTDYSYISPQVVQPYPQRTIDVSVGGPYAVYNWELLFHSLVGIAIHLTQNQRFAEAQKWFHRVFDPTSSDERFPIPQRYWRFIGFQGSATSNMASLLVLLSTPDSDLLIEDPTGGLNNAKKAVLHGYEASTATPFMPHAVARTRPIAYQYYVVMKYLDNLIAWGDSLFSNPTIETINEATLCYVMAANLLGPKPEPVPAAGSISPMSYAQLKQNAALGQLDPMGNALVELEAQFPFNLGLPPPSSGGGGQSGSLFGMGRSLYFCVPQNPTFLRYWDVVSDRLFKIRHCQTLQGQPLSLDLWGSPIDPGMLVKAAAAGVDVGSIVNGLNQPLGPVRCITRIQRALELCSEVRSFGNALLAAFEKGDAEQLGQLRQNHESALQQMTQNVRFLQWQQSQQATAGLLRSRSAALERYQHYLRLLGLSPDATTPTTFDPLDRQELNEDNFTDAFASLVSQYDLPVTLQPYPQLRLASASSASNQSGASGSGNLYLNDSEDAELNVHMPRSRDTQLGSSIAEVIAEIVVLIPDFDVDISFWGIGPTMEVFGGTKLASAFKGAAELLRIAAAYEQAQGGMAGRTAGYQRRVDDWVLQANSAARELRLIGVQVLGSLIAEQVAEHEYKSARAQVSQGLDILNFLAGQTVSTDDGSSFIKLTTADFYGWMQGELSRLYYQYYRLALDAARKAEQTVKRELMRPELDSTSFIQPAYWDKGRQGLLSGEALFLDLKRLEGAYIDNNKRELELTSYLSLRQIAPLALLSLKVTGTCSFSIPEAYYDRTCPGHYMRRIKSIGLSVPAVVGPYTAVNCSLAIQNSSIRVSSLLEADYARTTDPADGRFVDYFSSVEEIVTSGGNSDTGMFETNLRDERFLPFEGQGAISTWNLSLPDPNKLPPFDYSTISDVIVQVRYTARDGGRELADAATQSLQQQLEDANQAGLGLLLSLRHDFPTEWSAFVTGTGDFTMSVQESYFPFMVHGFKIELDKLTLYTSSAGQLAQAAQGLPPVTELVGATDIVPLHFPADAVVLTRDPSAEIFLLIQYHLSK